MQRSEKTLVSFTVINALLAFFTYFSCSFNNIGRSIFGGRLGIVMFLVYLIVVIVSSRKNSCFNTKNLKNAFVLTIAFLGILIVTWISSGHFESFFIIAIVYVGVFLLMKDNLKFECFELFIKILSVILLLSLVEYIFVTITGIKFVLFQNERISGEGLYLEQLIFNLLTETNTDFYRFQSLCEEPGLVGTVCGLLIFLIGGEKKYKKQFYIFLISGMLSFSLAFYIMLVVYLLFFNSLNKRSFFVIVILLLVGYVIFSSLLDTFIMYRIAGREISEIDNRAGGDFSYQFSKAWDNGDLWFSNYGKGDEDGAGLKVFIWRYGLVSLIILFLSYTLVYFRQVKSYHPLFRKVMFFFLIFWISFYQRSNITDMEYVLCYFIAPLLFSRDSHIKTNKVSVINTYS